MRSREESFYGYVQNIDDALYLFEAVRREILPRIFRRLTEVEQQSIRSGSVFIWNEDEALIKRWTDGKFWSNSRMKGRFFLYKELHASKKSIQTERMQRLRSKDPLTVSSSNGSQGMFFGCSPINPHLVISTSPSNLTSEDASGIDSFFGSNMNSQKIPTPADDYYHDVNIPCNIPKKRVLRKKAISVKTRENQKFHLVNYYYDEDIGKENRFLQRPSEREELKRLHVDPGFYQTGLEATPLMITNSDDSIHSETQSPSTCEATVHSSSMPSSSTYSPAALFNCTSNIFNDGNQSNTSGPQYISPSLPISASVASSMQEEGMFKSFTTCGRASSFDQNLNSADDVHLRNSNDPCFQPGNMYQQFYGGTDPYFGPNGYGYPNLSQSLPESLSFSRPTAQFSNVSRYPHQEGYQDFRYPNSGRIYEMPPNFGLRGSQPININHIPHPTSEIDSRARQFRGPCKFGRELPTSIQDQQFSRSLQFMENFADTNQSPYTGQQRSYSPKAIQSNFRGKGGIQLGGPYRSDNTLSPISGMAINQGGNFSGNRFDHNFILNGAASCPTGNDLYQYRREMMDEKHGNNSLGNLRSTLRSSSNFLRSMVSEEANLLSSSDSQNEAADEQVAKTFPEENI